MFFDPQSSLIGGSLAGSVIVYGLLSAFATGPEILHRESEKIGWRQSCERIVKAELAENAPAPAFVPKVDPSAALDKLFGPRWNNPLRDMLAPVEDIAGQALAYADQLQTMNRMKLKRQSEVVGSRCSCAVIMLGEERLSLALYAGTGRLITPSVFKNLESELHASLRSPKCGGS